MIPSNLTLKKNKATSSTPLDTNSITATNKITRSIQPILILSLIFFILLSLNLFETKESDDFVEFHNGLEQVVLVETENLQLFKDEVEEICRKRELFRIQNYKIEHGEKGRPKVFGLRGISWIYTNLQGTLLAAPELEKIFKKHPTELINGKIEFDIRDVSEKKLCDPKKANLISIYTRISGPEIIAKLAEPITGECRWKVKFDITIPGSYTILARLLHYNGKQDLGDECRTLDKNEAKNVYLEILHEIPRYPYYNTPIDCCMMCTRFTKCRYSLHGANIRDEKRWGKGSQCLLFKTSTRNGNNSILAENVFNQLNISDQSFPIRYSGSRLKEYPLGSIWQLACGRDEMLLRWAPCGDFGAPKYSSMHGTEDIILFEHEHRNLLIYPIIGENNSRLLTIQEAQIENDAKVGAKERKPVCSWKELLSLPDFDRGRWTISPFERTQHCGKLDSFRGSNIHTAPKYSKLDDPMCYLRFHLQNFNDDSLRHGVNSYISYQAIWKSELSDNYFVSKKGSNEPFVPGPWIGYYRLHPETKCRMPRLRTANEIKTCLISKSINQIVTEGDSIVEFLDHYMNILINAAFKINDEYSFTEDRNFEFHKINSSKKIAVANLAIAHRVTLYTYEQNLKLVEDYARTAHPNAILKIFFTSPFFIWERRQYMTAERGIFYSKEVAKIMKKYGWYVIDLNTLSSAWTLDSTIERDSLHIIGHTNVLLSQLIFDIICTEID